MALEAAGKPACSVEGTSAGRRGPTMMHAVPAPTMTTALPGPRGHFLVGNLPEMRRDWLGFLVGVAREYGDCAAFRLGPQRVVLVSHPDWIEQVLVRDSRGF